MFSFVLFDSAIVSILLGAKPKAVSYSNFGLTYSGLVLFTIAHFVLSQVGHIQ